MPADGPYSKTEVKTNVSEMEIVAGTEGSLTVAEPCSSVRAARISQRGPSDSCQTPPTECAMTAVPAKDTAATNSWPRLGEKAVAHRSAGRADDLAGPPLAYRRVRSKRLFLASVPRKVSTKRWLRRGSVAPD